MEIRAEIPVKRVTLRDIRTLVKAQRNQVYIAAQGSLYKKPMVYLHVSAGWHDHIGQEEGHYQFCIAGDGIIYMPEWAYQDLVATDSDGVPLTKATWHRNTGSINVAILAGVDSVACGAPGPNPPTNEQVESMAQLIAVLCDVLGIPITYEWVRTHAEQADEEGDDSYGPKTTWERWDLWYVYQSGEGSEPGTGGDFLRGKAQFYLNSGELA